MKYKAFTLVELILVMALLAILTVLLIGNLNSSLKKGRDAQRKNDLAQLQRALELYYEDNKGYPPFTSIFGIKLCKDLTCVLGEAGYMVKTPNDPNTTNYQYIYYPAPTGSSGRSSYYYLYSYIENNLDKGSNVSIPGFVNPYDSNITECGVTTPQVVCRYYTSSSNAPQLTPAP